MERAPHSEAQQSTTRAKQLLGAGDVGEGLVHAGERRALGVLADARRPHGDPDVGRRGASYASTMPAARSSGIGTVCTRLRASDARRSRSSCAAVRASAENGHQPVPDARPAHGIEVRLTGDDEPGRHGKAARRQLAEVGTLASHRVRVPQPDVFEPANFLHDPYLRNCAWPWRPLTH